MSLIISTIISILTFFIEQWWSANHPIKPTLEAKTAFLKKIGGLRYFWMGANRGKYGAILFDKFVANYEANPPLMTLHSFSADQAKNLAAQYAAGLTI